MSLDNLVSHRGANPNLKVLSRKGGKDISDLEMLQSFYVIEKYFLNWEDIHPLNVYDLTQNCFTIFPVNDTSAIQ